MPFARAERWRSFAADWAKRRHGEDSHTVTLKRRRIFILPTRHGLMFAGVMFAMLLASLNYGANLGFALTFLLAGLGLVVMHHCHNNLLAITVRFGGADAVFAGDEARFRMTLCNDATADRLDIVAEAGEFSDGPVDLAPGASDHLDLYRPTERRGYVRLPRFSIATRYPANLFRAWAWMHMDARCLVYPRPAPPGRPLPTGSDSLGTRSPLNRDEDDFAGLKDATASDPPRRIAWKAFARSEQLLVKEFSGGAERPCLFDFGQLPELDDEKKLSQLTRWCLDAADARLAFGLVLPDRRIPLGSGQRHLHLCLEALALYGLKP
jgi:uncharacterized protein (DUF58 family)